ncbi:2234_t:CDS:2 [Diversispora eburnea]|uniref:2234_t:CDS:1 n=1 Tax=Diversispora eburnea TaxID=1213867 RepID=A0A9N8WH34_9GLOM|nr:2234_t:CDS:2 [Diversispora eburnea]
MFTTERSRDFGKWCVTLGQGILALALMDISEKSLLSTSFPKYITPTSQISPKFIIQKPLPSSSLSSLKRSKSQSQQKQLLKQTKELSPLSMIDWKKIVCPSKRYSTPIASSIPSYLIKSKRNMSVKLIISTAANRIMIHQKSRTAAISQLSHSIYDKNLKLVEDRPTIYQQRRRLHKKQSPSMTLQVARRCLKIMLKIKNHRNTI